MCPFSDSRQIYKNQFDKKEKEEKKKDSFAKKITDLHLFCSTFALFLLLNDTFPDFSNRKTNIRNPKDI